MPSDNGKIQWAPKVSRIKIRRLYELDAQGIIDVDLIDEVGWALWERCDSILTVTAAHNGHVLCPACGTFVERQDPWSADEYVTCAECDWQIPWAVYQVNLFRKSSFSVKIITG